MDSKIKSNIEEPCVVYPWVRTLANSINSNKFYNFNKNKYICKGTLS